MAKIRLEISSEEMRASVAKALLASGHDLIGSEPGAHPLPDVVLTDEEDISERLAAYGEDGASLIRLCGPDPDPRKLAGFDDFVLEPSDIGELLLRIGVAIARSDGERGGRFEMEGLVADFSSFEMFSDGVPLDLTYTEFELFRTLAENEGRVLSREQLLEKVWGYDYFGGSRTVDVHIRRLRSKLGSRHQGLIETVRNVGYRLRKVRRYQ